MKRTAPVKSKALGSTRALHEPEGNDYSGDGFTLYTSRSQQSHMRGAPSEWEAYFAITCSDLVADIGSGATEAEAKADLVPELEALRVEAERALKAIDEALVVLRRSPAEQPSQNEENGDQGPAP